MPGVWSYEQTRSLVGVWCQSNVQDERDGVTRNPVVFERIAWRGKYQRRTTSLTFFFFLIYIHMYMYTCIHVRRLRKLLYL